ncbi:hypothetical protein WK55_09770 [Burkholderia ubonensis]|uniref:hypothetical protein n=1 Tax=Burkholderia ubonensis TaxID=101571 RepID=UPI00076C9E5F|nr:hypothetical protein [Burkholderia ubonensis]KVT60623.1 hypothetical protein WK55_09770 [Burkholderia ubonensis]
MALYQRRSDFVVDDAYERYRNTRRVAPQKLSMGVAVMTERKRDALYDRLLVTIGILCAVRMPECGFAVFQAIEAIYGRDAAAEIEQNVLQMTGRFDYDSPPPTD